MKHYNRIVINCFLLILMTFIGSCNSDDPTPIIDSDFYPISQNKIAIYKVEETEHKASSSTPVITKWEEKHEVIRIIEEPTNFTTYVILLSKRDAVDTFWKKAKEYTVSKHPDKILESGNNLVVLPLVFPINTQIKWDYNSYNTLDPDQPNENICRYENIGSPLTLESTTYSNTITVIDKDWQNDDIVQYNYGFRQYALGIGLVYQESTEYVYCQDGSCLGNKIISSGKRTIKSLVSTE